ncbi:hypothetical protein N1851_022562 [Merluccius polli]|uniref:Uncharacterized protein n=1 Tax=Merluccius polli TaxID=89951 RepID=A0AA47NX28_MERPO|nr:hypothetical protein N1851_022562 [Merluccius polli]
MPKALAAQSAAAVTPIGVQINGAGHRELCPSGRLERAAADTAMLKPSGGAARAFLLPARACLMGCDGPSASAMFPSSGLNVFFLVNVYEGHVFVDRVLRRMQPLNGDTAIETPELRWKKGENERVHPGVVFPSLTIGVGLGASRGNRGDPRCASSTPIGAGRPGPPIPLQVLISAALSCRNQWRGRTDGRRAVGAADSFFSLVARHCHHGKGRQEEEAMKKRGMMAVEGVRNDRSDRDSRHMCHHSNGLSSSCCQAPVSMEMFQRGELLGGDGTEPGPDTQDCKGQRYTRFLFRYGDILPKKTHSRLPCAGDNWWCCCGKRAPMETEVESLCCTEASFFRMKLLSLQRKGHKHVQFHQAANRHLLEWIIQGERLGRENHLVWTACVVQAIRAAFPSPDRQHHRFKETTDAQYEL